MNLATWSLRNPIPAILLFVLLSLAGVRGFQQLSIQNMPDLDLPTINIMLSQPGAAPAQLETEVARKVEDSLIGLQGLKHVSSSITDGQVHIKAEFVLEKPLSDALIQTKDAVDRVRSDLPTDLEQPSISAVTTGDGATLTYALASDRLDEEALSWFIDDELTKALMAVPGVGKVTRLGGVQREVRVEIDPVRLAAQGATVADVSRALRSTQQESSGGRGQLGNGEQSVRTIATVRQAGELAALPLTLADGRQLRLDQVATVRDASAEATSAALLDGKRVSGFDIHRSKGFDETRIATGVTEVLRRLRDKDASLRFTPVSGSVAYTLEQYHGSMQMLIEGALLAVLVVWWFLRDWRATLVAASALPLSVLPAFAAMAWLGYSLNTLTLLALAVIVGILVDDAIVEIENIERHRRMGKPILQATGDAVNEIALAVIATTMTLVVVFVPTTMMGGVPGLFFKQFGWTAVIAVLASLVVARLLTPMMAAYLLKPIAHAEEKDSWMMVRYLRVMRWCLTHRGITALAAAAFFVGSISLVGMLPTGFVPAADRAQTQINLELPPGSTLAETGVIAERARLAAMEVPGVTSVFSSIGGGSSGDAFAPGAAAEARSAVLTITTVHRTDRKESMADIDDRIRTRLDAIPGARFKVGPPDNGVKLQLVLRSDDPVALQATAQKVEREMRTLQGVGNVRSSASLVRPEIIVTPDFAKAADLGVTANAIGQTVRVATAGDYDTDLTKMNLPERQVPIRVKLPDSVRADLDAIGRLTVPGKNGPVLLATVATITMESGPAQINRLNRSRNVTFEVELGRRALGEVDAEARALPSLKNLPPSVKIAELGDTQEMAALFASFGLAMLIGVLCIYCVLVLLFKDFMQPVTILAALPLSIGGAFVALLITRSALSMPSMIGLIMLMGIVTKNSILLVDYAILARQEGMNRFDALVDACHKRSRPILMTTIAMGAGMMPLALGWGADPSFRSPMAITVIGGLITSTLLSLLVVPAVFTYIDDFEHLLGRLMRKLRRHPAPAADRDQPLRKVAGGH